MLQRELYFFGKLNQSRDFIVSDNLQADDKHFWDGWFGRCTSQDRLIPFTRKTFTTPKTWLFCIKLLNNIAYTGITALSADQTGRQYPFLLFCKSDSHSDLLNPINFIAEKTDFFQNTLNSGKCTIQDCFSADADNTPIQLSEPFRHYLSNSTNTGSFWQESESGRHIAHEGEPSCTLFNKLFGS
ncbi:type VI secretion system-associated protein TagF [Neisseria sp. 83E34]|uniref:type VI secretion system-associated protein TagF n=1 Tax=Neisseria sp. 83E34 TaxID=1692264 RepID=UPI0006CE9EEF|nr:type VI secretion system-associated protein TagF [Neisseria sp. 83E34]KPN70621.1 type VI secretion protein [Neisseria sp. 83E34]